MIKILSSKSLYNALFSVADFCVSNEGEDIEIVVPDKLSLFMEKFLFEHLNMSASFNIKVNTFNRFAKKNCLIEKEKQISKVGSILLIHKILNENISNLKILKNKAYSFTYAENVFRTIGQLKASKIKPEEMLDFKLKEDQQLTDKIQDLALIYSEYETLKAGLLDAADSFLLSAFTVAKGRQNCKILFVGFDDFTAIEYSIIEQLAKDCEVYVFNYANNESNKYIFNHETKDQLRNIAIINQLPFEIVELEDNSSNLKKFLHNNLYGIKDNRFLLGNETVTLYSAKNVAEEIEYVAQGIRKQILEGAKFKNFGVAVFNLESYATKIKEIFEKYEINYYIDSKLNISSSIFYKFISSVLKLNLEGYSLNQIIDIINSPFFNMPIQRKQEIVSKLLAVNFRGKITNDVNLQIEDCAKEKLVKFFEFLQFNKNEPVEDVLNKLKVMDSALGFESILNELASNGDAQNKILLTKSREVVFNLFDEILRFNNLLTLDGFYDVFSHIASVVNINNLPQHLDCVKIVEADENMELFDNLYLVNCVASVAPNLKFDCGIIVDSEIQKLNFANKLNPTIAHINKLARLRLYNSVLLFNKNLTITYSQNPSELIKELNSKLQIKIGESITNIPILHLFKYNKYNALSKLDYIDFVCKNKINNINKNIEFNENLIKNNEINQLSKENLNIFNNLKTISASTLESYFKCPFYAFVASTLKIRPRIENEIQSLDIGNMLHEILFVYYKLNKQVGDIYDFCKTQVFGFVEKDERLKLNLKSPILTNLIDEAVRVINGLNYIDENSLFKPEYFEHEFANKTALKLKNIDVIGKVDRVDVFNDMFRIVDYKSGKADASLKELYYGNKLQLFLYSCAIENELNKKAVGTFYLPLHNAYQREIKNPYSLKGFYLAENFVADAMDKRINETHLSDIVNLKLLKDGGVAKGLSHKELSISELNNLKAYSEKVSEQAVEEIKSGYIAPTPSDISKPCEYCPYVHICMKSSNAIEYRRSSKVQLQSFKEDGNE